MMAAEKRVHSRAHTDAPCPLDLSVPHRGATAASCSSCTAVPGGGTSSKPMGREALSAKPQARAETHCS